MRVLAILIEIDARFLQFYNFLCDNLGLMDHIMFLLLSLFELLEL